MKKFFFTLVASFLFFGAVPLASADTGGTETVFVEDFFRAEVKDIIREGEEEYLGHFLFTQWLLVELLEGEDKAQTMEIPYRNTFGEREDQKISPGEKIIVVKTQYDGESSYRFFERYRLN